MPDLSASLLLTAAWSLGILPLCWLIGWRSRDRVAWGVAMALAVSFVADAVALDWMDPAIIGNTYLFLQGALLVLAITEWHTATSLAALYAVTAVGSVLYEGPTAFGLWLPTVVGVSVCWLAVRWAAPLRWSVLLTFGGGLLAWYYWAWLAAHAPALAGRGWWCFHLARLGGVLAFARATWPTRARSGVGWVSP